MAVAAAQEDQHMAKGQIRSNKEAKKPKKEKPKVIAAAPSTKNSVTIAGTKTKT